MPELVQDSTPSPHAGPPDRYSIPDNTPPLPPDSILTPAPTAHVVPGVDSYDWEAAVLPGNLPDVRDPQGLRRRPPDVRGDALLPDARNARRVARLDRERHEDGDASRWGRSPPPTRLSRRRGPGGRGVSSRRGRRLPVLDGGQALPPARQDGELDRKG